MKLNTSLLKGSLVLLLFFNLFNLINFLFHFVMARVLTIGEYGILATLFSIIYLFGVFTESIQTVVTRYVSQGRDEGSLKSFLKRALSKSFSLSLIIFIFYTLLAIPLSYWLRIDYPILVLNGITIFASLFVPVTRGMLQGTKRFYALGWAIISEAVLKLVSAFVLVYIGWRIYGAVTGIIIGVFASLAISLWELRSIFKAKEKKLPTEDALKGYIKPTFFITLVIILFYSIDIVLARLFFSETVAGSYALASVLAKTIFLVTQPISKAMFPFSAQIKKHNSSTILMNALGMLVPILLVSLILFYLFPSFILLIFSGKVVPLSASILFYLGVAISFISLGNLFLLHSLSQGKVKGYGYLILSVGIEVILLSYFSANLIQFSFAFIVSSATFLWASSRLLHE